MMSLGRAAYLSLVSLSATSACLFAAAPAIAQDAASGSVAAPAPPAPAAAKPTQTADGSDKALPAEEKRNHPVPNSVFAEGRGAGIIYSINYERMVLDQLGVRVGFSYLSVGASATAGGASASSSTTYLMFPITASYTGIRSRNGAGLELGGGTTLLYTSASASALGTSTSGSGVTPLAVAMVGFRLHPIDHAGVQFRIGAMALGGQGLGLQAADPTKFGFIPWGYLSLGGSF
jgi:hypothetical protein